MKRIFKTLSGVKREKVKMSGFKTVWKVPYFLDFWLVTKDFNKSRCVDYKQLLRTQALAEIFG